MVLSSKSSNIIIPWFSDKGLNSDDYDILNNVNSHINNEEDQNDSRDNSTGNDEIDNDNVRSALEDSSTKDGMDFINKGVATKATKGNTTASGQRSMRVDQTLEVKVNPFSRRYMGIGGVLESLVLGEEWSGKVIGELEEGNMTYKVGECGHVSFDWELKEEV